MRSENYVAFFTVCGFFIGLIFSIVKVNTIADLFLYTLSITLFFHMFIHVVLVYFINANEFSRFHLTKMSTKNLQICK